MEPMVWDGERNGVVFDREIVDNNYSVNMIRHNDVFVQLGLRKMIGNFQPTLLCHFATFIHPHIPIDNFTKQTFAIVRHDGDEIDTRLGVIVSLQTNGMSVVFRVIHYFLFLPIINFILFHFSPSTIAISSSVNSYNLYTNWSISFSHSLVSECGLSFFASRI